MRTREQLAGEAHALDDPQLLRLVPLADPADLDSIRQELARFIIGRRPAFRSWQEAWNDLTRARHAVSYRPAQCRACQGRGAELVGPTNRTGHAACSECHGSGRPIGRLTVPAHPVYDPATEDTDDPTDLTQW